MVRNARYCAQMFALVVRNARYCAQTFALVARNVACVLRPERACGQKVAIEAELQFRAVTQFAAIVTDSQSCASRGL